MGAEERVSPSVCLSTVQYHDKTWRGAGRGEALPPPPDSTPSFRAAYGLIMRPNDFASYLLAIGICNLLLYFAFYIIMKVNGKGLGHEEKGSLLATCLCP